MDLARAHADILALASQLALPPGVTIRAWEETDFPSVQRMSAAESWPTPSERPEAALRAWHHSWPALVALDSEAVIGFVRAVSDGEVTTYVAELLIEPAWRGRGIASGLLHVAQHLCPGTRLDLLATPASGTFYERVGFHQFAGYRRSWPHRDAPHPARPRNG